MSSLENGQTIITNYNDYTTNASLIKQMDPTTNKNFNANTITNKVANQSFTALARLTYCSQEANKSLNSYKKLSSSYTQQIKTTKESYNFIEQIIFSFFSDASLDKMQKELNEITSTNVYLQKLSKQLNDLNSAVNNCSKYVGVNLDEKNLMLVANSLESLKEQRLKLDTDKVDPSLLSELKNIEEKLQEKLDKFDYRGSKLKDFPKEVTKDNLKDFWNLLLQVKKEKLPSIAHKSNELAKELEAKITKYSFSTNEKIKADLEKKSKVNAAPDIESLNAKQTTKNRIEEEKKPTKDSLQTPEEKAPAETTRNIEFLKPGQKSFEETLKDIDSAKAQLKTLCDQQKDIARDSISNQGYQELLYSMLYEVAQVNVDKYCADLPKKIIPFRWQNIKNEFAYLDYMFNFMNDSLHPTPQDLKIAEARINEFKYRAIDNFQYATTNPRFE